MTAGQLASDAIDIIPKASYADSGDGSFFGSAGMSFVNVPASIENRVIHHSPLVDTGGENPPWQLSLLPGEVKDSAEDFGTFQLIITNIRLCVLSQQDKTAAIFPTVSIDSIDWKDGNTLTVSCKDLRVVRLPLPSAEKCVLWHKLILRRMTRNANFTDIPAWDFAAAVEKEGCHWLKAEVEENIDLCQKEWDRLKYDPDHFCIYEGNKDYKVTDTYPERTVIMKNSEKVMQQIKDFRFIGRYPAVVWKCNESRAVLLRSAQPRCGLFSWRNQADEGVFANVHTYHKAYAETTENQTTPKIYILDARGYAAAWANRAKGGGFESPEYYQNTETTFLNLPNIHSIRYSFYSLRTLLSNTATIDPNTYLNQLNATNWLNFLSQLLTSAYDCVDYLASGNSVLVHCSDGWDRTTQIVSFVKLIGDDYYRTLTGFEELIRREWIEFGHKFADRNGIVGNSNESSPVFLQWLDGVYQLMRQNPTAFEFSHQYLLKLVQHAHSAMFDAFIFNSTCQAAAEKEKKKQQLVSLWRFLGDHNDIVVNQLYVKQPGRLTVKPSVQNLEVWRECYCADQQETFPVHSDSCTREEVSHHRPSSAATSPVRDQGLQKSKSSESLNSLHNTSPPEAGLANHSESNGTLNTLVDNHSMENSMVGMTDSYLRRENRPRSKRLRRSIKSIQELVDHDGLVKFYDATQESARKQKLENARELRRKECEINNLKRDRSLSERTNLSAISRDRMISGDFEGELDSLSILDRAPSDMSLVEHSSEFPTQSGWHVKQDKCSLCSRQFSSISLKSEDRPHHCRQCGRTVCDRCSPHTYHDIHEGKGIQARACVKCYSQMMANGDDHGTLDEAVDLEADLPPERRSPPMHNDEPEKPFKETKFSPQTVKG